MKKIFIALAMLWSSAASAQGLSSFDLYSFDPKMINPAFTAVSQQQSFMALGRVYYSRLSNPPSAVILSYDRQIISWKGGVGFNYRNNRNDIETQNEFEFLVSRKLQLSEKQYLSVGISLSYFSAILDLGNLRFNDPSDPLISSQVKRIPELI